jgi:hypothetical protein
MNKVTNNLAIKKSSMAVCLLISFLISSCSEEPLTKGVITVYDINGSPVSGVEVLLTQKEMGPGITQTDVQDRQISDYKGQTEHIVPMESLMNVYATQKQGNDTLLYGASRIRLTQGKTVYKDIEILPY